jgi:hypothetical protein
MMSAEVLLHGVAEAVKGVVLGSVGGGGRVEAQ